ncbi:membrane protein insertion efficiency factor YidD [Ideonella sp.]|uniref:membrane protein insertion efficiency factor YidD n=1 Tax=Ideonella sp. TaxID=1929293 RepID=UPI003BB579D5
MRGVVLGYRLLLSPWLGSSCRFEPTCSRYALDALDRHGAAAGSYLAVSRILRCHPWCAGGCDPVPQARPRLFRHLFPEATSACSPAAGPAADTTASAPPATIDPQTSSRPLS